MGKKRDFEGGVFVTPGEGSGVRRRGPGRGSVGEVKKNFAVSEKSRIFALLKL